MCVFAYVQYCDEPWRCHLLLRLVGFLCGVDRERELWDRSADSGLSTAAGAVCPLCSRCLSLYFFSLLTQFFFCHPTLWMPHWVLEQF